ncbi:alkaline phosphatase family protein (plasmid) [Halobaculum sp. CBA1158]|uniref:alkaline phosphatase family protein n=1 Tax=Halobaculum sp. CBA1158 TaxID=2904243 RepID=UPI001F324847|nr:alkaline phosphatase family protein [Halobaculum sp. CBA1158]UIP01528.1 alkaline phosphatase family protein [Halobaculum sp. CBA1158]
MTTITIGLDGANWDLIVDWLDAGDLPNLAALIDDGVGGVCRSCLPPITVPNWKCYATGKGPGKLGVFRFDRIDTEQREHVFHDATDFDSAELWDYLTDEGMTAGVINKPSTYPPKEIDGFVVAGGPDASETAYRSLDRGFATPDRVERFLREELDYRVHPSPMISPSETGEAEVDAVLDLIDLRFDAASALLEREDPDFLHLTVFYSMALQHYFYDDEPVERAWKRIDDRLGEFLGEGHDVLVMSDHGTCDVDAVFYVNVWLQRQGYLSVERTVDGALRRAGITRERALSAAKRLGLVETLSKVVPERIQRVVPWEEGVKRDRVLSVLDWDATDAVASNQGPIYLTRSPGEPGYEELRTELIEGLESLRHPETGTPIVRSVRRGEEQYTGPHADEAPDLILDQGEGIHTSDAIGREEPIADSGVWRGGNMPEGVFVFSGPSFRSDGLTERARIVDLAPTLLHSMGAAVPDDLDGEVLDVFAPDSAAAERPVRTRSPLAPDRGRDAHAADAHDGGDADGDGTGVEDRLADLGYLE